MRIAVTSQNRKTITGHAGKCRKFWIYETTNGQITEKSLLELPKERSFHESHEQESHPLEGVHVLLSGGMGSGLQFRLRQQGIDALITRESDPDRAVAAYLTGTLIPGDPEVHEGHEGHHESHDEEEHCGCGHNHDHHDHHHHHTPKAQPLFVADAAIGMLNSK